MKINARNCLLASMVLAFGNSMMWAELPSDYYMSLDGLCGAELKTAVHQLCRDNYVLPKSSTVSTYTDLKNLFEQTDFREIEGEMYWWDMYSNVLNPMTMTFSDCSYQREHSFPKNWWKDATQTKDVEYTTAYCDMHHLFPSNGSANSSKSNWPLGVCGSTPTFSNGAVKIGVPAEGVVYGVSDLPSDFKVFEPGDEYKGDFARAYMYIVSAYQDLTWNSTTLWMVENNTYPTFTEWAQKLIMEWSRADQVSQKEIDRNNAVEEIQKNRNPYIDLPNLSEYVWGDSISRPLNVLTTVKSYPQPEVPGESAVFYESTLTGDETGDCTVEGDDSVWKHDSQYGWKGSAYNGEVREAQAKLFTPEIDLTVALRASLCFDHAVNKGAPTPLRVYILCDGEETDISDQISWPAGNSWTFISSGDVNLKPFCGKKMQVVFEYNSTSEEACTWEIKNLVVGGEQPTTSICIPNTECDNAPVEYYSMDGLRVQPGSYRGIVIRRQGTRVSRTILK